MIDKKKLGLNVAALPFNPIRGLLCQSQATRSPHPVPPLETAGSPCATFATVVPAGEADRPHVLPSGQATAALSSPQILQTVILSKSNAHRMGARMVVPLAAHPFHASRPLVAQPTSTLRSSPKAGSQQKTSALPQRHAQSKSKAFPLALAHAIS